MNQSKGEGSLVKTKPTLLILALTFFACLLLPLIIALLSGNLSIPHNDAWSHSRIAKTFADTGEIHLLFWNRPALIGQFIFLGPLASSIAIQQFFVWLLAIVMLFSIFYLVKDEIGNLNAAICVFLISLFPGFMLLSTSFMTDIPMFAAIFSSLAIAKHALRTDSRAYFVLSLIVGAWGFTIREQALAAPFAIAISALLQRHQLKKVNFSLILISFVSILVFIGYFYYWRRTLAGDDPAPFQLNPNIFQSIITGLVKGWFHISLVAGISAILVLRIKKHMNQIYLTIIIGLFTFALIVNNFDSTYFFLP